MHEHLTVTENLSTLEFKNVLGVMLACNLLKTHLTCSRLQDTLFYPRLRPHSGHSEVLMSIPQVRQTQILQCGQCQFTPWIRSPQTTRFGETLISHTSPLVSRDPLRLISKQSSTEVRESAESECTHISIMKKEKGEANFQRSPEVLSLRMCISIRGRLECRRDCDM